MRKIKKALCAILAGLLVALLAGCAGAADKAMLTMQDFSRAKIGVLTGSSQARIAQEKFPEARLVHFSRPADMVLAVEQGKIDCYMFGSPFLAATIWENAQVKRIEEAVSHGDIAFAFPKASSDSLLNTQLNAFIRQSKADGTMDALKAKWLGATEPTEHPDYASLTGENGTIRLAVVAENKPLIYMYQDRCTGLEMELLTAFARQYGYRYAIETVPFDSVIMGMATGKYDMTSASLQVTSERAESVCFSEPYMQFDVVLVVKDTPADTAAATPDSLANANIGIMTGTVWDKVAQKELPDVQLKYFSSTTDLLLALGQGKLDGVLGPRTFYATARWENVPVQVQYTTESTISSGFMLQKEGYDQTLLQQLNAFLAQAKADGTIHKLTEKWLAEAEPDQHPDYASLTGENGTLRIAVDNTAKPMVYRKNDTFTGFDVELLTAFAQQYGYRLEFEGMAFDALIAYVSGGKCDLGACGVGITPERAESVTFTEPYLELGGVLMTPQQTQPAPGQRFLTRLTESFEKTFIRESRWKLILEGIAVTLIISLCATVFGTLLGFGLYMASRSPVKFIRLLIQGITKVYTRIVAGTPVVVILMILFYVIFGKVRDMSGILVAIICFSLTFGAFLYQHMGVSVNSIDPGQTEAAYALGYTRNKAFFRVVFPQAMTLFLPAYCSHAVELVKATAVVGYIAVNDLTKMGDIIRSNTYEAFFPLIATALIYFLLTWVISLLLGLIRLRFTPKRRSAGRILRRITPQ